MKIARLALATTVCCSFISAGAFAADKAAVKGAVGEVITVEAPRMVKRENLPMGQGQLVTLAATVKYGDLNLQDDAGAKEFEARVGTAAADVCNKLEFLYPSGTPNRTVCAQRATDKAMVDVHALIDEARAAP